MDFDFFFRDFPESRGIFDRLHALICSEFPAAVCRVQKTQISYSERYGFACASLPRKKDQRGCLMVSIGYGERLDHPRVSIAVEAAPGRWTHHILLCRPEDVDGELLFFLRLAHDFSLSK